MDPSDPRTGLLPRIGWLIALSLALFLALLPFSAYIASLPFIQAEWGMSNAAAAVVFSSYLIGYALSSLIVVPLTDRFPPQRVLVVGIAILVGGNLLFPFFAHDIGSGALLRALTGAGQVGAYIPAIRLVTERFPGPRRATAVGFFVAAGYAGTTLSYTFMGQLLARLPSWQAAYFVTSLVGVGGLVFALIATRGGASVTPAPASGRLDLRVLRMPAVTLNTVAYALHTAELYLARLWFPLLLGAALVQSGMADDAAVVRAATLSGLMFMMGIAGVFMGGALSDRIGRWRGATLIFSVSGLCSLIAGFLLDAPALLIALGFVYGFATAADSAIYSTSIVEVAPPGQVGSAQAVQSFVGFAIGALVPVIAGSLLDRQSGPQGWIWAFGFNALLAAGGVGALWTLSRLRAHRAPHADRG